MLSVKAFDAAFSAFLQQRGKIQGAAETGKSATPLDAMGWVSPHLL
jgi:hypothetical protein